MLDCADLCFLTLNWTAGILTNGDWNWPKELLLKKSTHPCPIYHLSPLLLDSGVEGGGAFEACEYSY